MAFFRNLLFFVLLFVLVSVKHNNHLAAFVFVDKFIHFFTTSICWLDDVCLICKFVELFR